MTKSTKGRKYEENVVESTVNGLFSCFLSYAKLKRNTDL